MVRGLSLVPIKLFLETSTKDLPDTNRIEGIYNEADQRNYLKTIHINFEIFY